MQPHWYGILLATWMAGCTTETPPVEPKSIHDHFKRGLDVLGRQRGHPCGVEFDVGDGQIVVDYTYAYDSLGRLQTNTGIDRDGALYQRSDYAWDNAGHLTSLRNATPGEGSVRNATWLYDTLGRLTQSRNALSDLDPMDAHQVANTRTTVTYLDFDERGNPAHAAELEENLDAQTSQMRTQSFEYDALGRQTSLEVRTASGEPYLSEQAVYDDAALQITWQLQPAPSLAPAISASLRATDQYDGDGRWLSRHQESLGPDGAVTMIQDIVLTWDGDRELSEVTSISPPDHLWTLRISRTFKYQCDGALRATAPREVSALPVFPEIALHLHR